MVIACLDEGSNPSGSTIKYETRRISGGFFVSEMRTELARVS